MGSDKDADESKAQITNVSDIVGDWVRIDILTPKPKTMMTI
jgi:hypothetical protein